MCLVLPSNKALHNTNRCKYDYVVTKNQLLKPRRHDFVKYTLKNDVLF